MFRRPKRKDGPEGTIRIVKPAQSPGKLSPAPSRRKRRWPRRVLIAAAVFVLLAAVAVGFLLANLKQIVLRRLRASLEGFRVSLESISLRSLSQIEVVGLELEETGGGAVIKFPRVDVRFRLSPFKGLTFDELELHGAEAFLRQEALAIVARPHKPAEKVKRPEIFQPGPPIGKILLRDSRLVVNAPDLKFDAFLDVTADSSLSGTLLNETNLSLRLRVASLETEPVRVKNLETGLSAFVNREATGRRIDVLRGRWHLADFFESSFRGSISLAGTGHEIGGALRIERLSLPDLLARLKEPFPELDAYELDGSAGGELDVRYITGERNEIVLLGNLSLREGRAVVSLGALSKGAASESPSQGPTDRLVAEGVGADVPVRIHVVDGETTLFLGSGQQHLAGATIVAAQINYGEEELASDLLALVELESKPFGTSPGGTAPLTQPKAPVAPSPSEPGVAPDEATAEAEGAQQAAPGETFPTATGRCRAFFRSHGGTVNAVLSGSLQGDVAEVQGDLNLQRIELERVVQRLGIGDYSVWGQLSGTTRLSCTAAKKNPLKVAGELSLRVPAAVVSLKEPLTVTGLEVNAPFEYSPSSGVESFRIKESESYPSGGDVTAVTIGYGEKVAEDGTSSPQWTVSGVSASAVSTPDGVKLAVSSCEAYDGEVTGDITVSLQKKVLGYGANLHVQDLDLERLTKGLGVKREKFYMDGLAEGDVVASGKAGKWDAAHGEFSSIAPGGVIRIEDFEKLMDSVPAGRSVLESLKQGRTPAQWNRFLEGMKEFRYRVARAKITYPPELPRPEGGTGPDLELHLEGTGADEDFIITIQIPITFHTEPAFIAPAL